MLFPCHSPQPPKMFTVLGNPANLKTAQLSLGLTYTLAAGQIQPSPLNLGVPCMRGN